VNAHAPAEDKHDDSKDSLCEGLEQVFNHLAKYHVEIMLRDNNAKLGEKIFSNWHLGLRVYV
jgi:hypothetical protein